MDERSVDPGRLRNVLQDVIDRRSSGLVVADDEIIAAHPDLMPELAHRLELLRKLDRAEVAARGEGSALGSEGGAHNVSLSSSWVLDAIPGYEIAEEIHRGGQGIVFRAKQLSTARDVAIKVTRSGPFTGPQERERFSREVHILSRLKHPQIATIFDSGTAGDCLYFVMDYIDGCSLDTYVADRGLSIVQTLALFVDICDAVTAAHLQGVIHRDLKPSNIRVDLNGTPHVLDFGLAKVNTVDDGPGMTQTGQFLGSLPWASPEQAEGDFKRIDSRTDVYSLGVVLYQLLTGEFPYSVDGTFREVTNCIISQAPVPPLRLNADIDGELGTILLKCLQKEPGRRYQSVGELGRDIQRYLDGDAIDAKRDSGLYILRKQLKRHRVAFSAIVAFVSLLAVSSVVFWTQWTSARRHLWESLLKQAQAYRSTHLPGRKSMALDAISAAAEIRPSLELRNEAIAALALTDIQMEKSCPLDANHILEGTCGKGRLLSLWCNENGGSRLIRPWGSERFLFDFSNAQGFQALIATLSHDGKRLVQGTTSEGNVWDVESGRKLVSFPLEMHKYGYPDFNSHGDMAVIGDTEGGLHVVDVESGKTVTWTFEDYPFCVIHCHPTEPLVAATGHGCPDVLIINTSTGEIISRLIHPRPVWGIAWSPDGSRVATGCDDRYVYIWDHAEERIRLRLHGHSSLATRLFFDSSGEFLFSNAWDGTTRVWNSYLGHCLTVLETKAVGPAFADRAIVCRSFNPPQLERRMVQRSDVFGSLYQPSETRPQVAKHIVLDPAGEFLAYAAEHGTHIWHWPSRTFVGTLPTGQASYAAFDGNCLVSASRDRGLQRWPVTTKGKTIEIGPPMQVSGVNRSFDGICLSPNGDALYAVVNRDHVERFDLHEGDEPVRTVATQPGARVVSISPTGEWLAVAGESTQAVWVWDLHREEVAVKLPIRRHAKALFSPGGHWLVTLSNECVLWEVGSWRPVKTFETSEYAGLLGSIAFSGSGEFLVIGNGKRFTRLVDMRSWETLAHFRCPYDISPEALAISAKGDMVFVPDVLGGAVHYWDLLALRKQLAPMKLEWDYHIASSTAAAPMEPPEFSILPK
jgi:serine/threonine protein kinase/WD40 repeat protein